MTDNHKKDDIFIFFDYHFPTFFSKLQIILDPKEFHLHSVTVEMIVMDEPDAVTQTSGRAGYSGALWWHSADTKR